MYYKGKYKKQINIIGMISIVLLLAFTVWLGYMSDGFTNWKVKEWFGDNAVEEIDEGGEVNVDYCKV